VAVLLPSKISNNTVSINNSTSVSKCNTIHQTMFDNTQPNIILMSDLTDVITMNKTLGPYKVAHVLRQAGFQVAVIHHLSVFSIQEILHAFENMISEKTLFVGVNNIFYADISGFFQDENLGVNISSIESGSILPHGKSYNDLIKNKIRDCNPNCRLVLGGPTARDAPHNGIFDYVLMGYSECSVINLAQHLLDPLVPLEKKYRSVYGPTIVNDSRAENYDFSGCTMRYEDHDVILPNETLVLEVARGCIFKCAFCSYPLNGKKKLDFIRSMDLMYQELMDNYQRFGVSRYIFSDDTVNDSVEKCQMLHEMSQRLPFELEWWGYLRLDLLAAHPETIDWLFGAGLRGAWFGIETLHPPTAKIIGKGGDRKKLFDAVRRIKSCYGNQVDLHGSFIYGLPREPISSLESTTEFLFSDQNPLDSFVVQPMSIRPNNETYSMDFLSDIDKNFSRYGYRIDGAKQSKGDRRWGQNRHESGQAIWYNEHTNRLEMEAMCRDIMHRRELLAKNKIPGRNALSLAGLGVDLDSILHKKTSEIDWHAMDKLKFSRAQEYKRNLFRTCKVPDRQTNLPDINTFSQWISGKHAL
jgi:radical SAM superfamily enzyme YgiQ (UPF0313 family)